MQNEGQEPEDVGENQETMIKLGNAEQCPSSGNTIKDLPGNNRLSNGAYDPADQDSTVRVVDLQATLDKQVNDKSFANSHQPKITRSKKNGIDLSNEKVSSDFVCFDKMKKLRKKNTKNLTEETKIPCPGHSSTFHFCKSKKKMDFPTLGHLQTRIGR